MKESSLGMKAWSQKAAALMIAGALAMSLVPATALAATVAEGGNAQTTDKLLASTANDPAHETVMWADGAWVKDPKTVTNGVYQWKTTIKGDGAHYGHYDALFTFTVKNGVLTAVDLTSQGTTFGGQWGTITPKSTNITGYLPAGVSVEGGDVQNAADSNKVKVGLAGAEKYGDSETAPYEITAITLCKAEDGVLKEEEVEEWDEEDQHYDTVIKPIGYDVSKSLTAQTTDEESDTASANAASRAGGGGYGKPAGPTLANSNSVDTSVVDWNCAEKSFTLTDPSAYNLARVTYKIGDYFVFDQYIALDGEDGEGAKYKIQATDLNAAATGIGAKNRDVYTAAAYAIMMQRELMSWQAVGAGAKTDIDTVSAATKSSDTIKEAIYALFGYSLPLSNRADAELSKASWGQLFTSVADDLVVTMDAGKSSAASVWDQTSVTTNANGDYVLSYKLSEDIPLSALAFYKSSSKLNIEQMWGLSKSETGKVGEYVTSNTGAHSVLSSLGDDEVQSNDVKWDSKTNTLTIKKSSGINYVVVGLGVGKLTQDRDTKEVAPLKGQTGIFCLPYSLEEMAAATAVTNQIKAMSSTDYNAVTAARTAYNALSPDARTFVGRTEVAKLNAANPAKPATSTATKPTTTTVKTVAQKLTVSGLSKSYSISYVKSGKLKAAKSFSLKTTGAKGKVTYKVSSYGKNAKKYLSLSSAGKVTVKKSTPVGTYTMKVKVSAAKATSGNTTYPAKSETKTVTVVVGAQTVKVGSASASSFKAASLKKKAGSFTAKVSSSSGKLGTVKVTKAVNAKGKAVKGFKVAKSGNKKIKVTVPKKLAKGTYKVTVKVNAKAVAKKYVAASATKTFTIKVK
ncbi:hypothetical protein [uncultured Adlercreutzia sp.]|uniref:hypothetical protein n=1 Tax=uncultured Adlercreutzia sp. TaxID=875803 RepID=UPI0025F5AA1F|nr:hypothetical protein [uncultured Adlercreutzia sp.]MCI9262228.1 hypothetical protein [Eggerthellaceae bacterium]